MREEYPVRLEDEVEVDRDVSAVERITAHPPGNLFAKGTVRFLREGRAS
jgi:hypothetical protein